MEPSQDFTTPTQHICMYTSTIQCVVEVTSSPRTLLPWGFGFSACFVWNPRCMANVVEGALFCAGASCFFVGFVAGVLTTG